MCLDVLYYIHGGRKSGHWGLKERTRFGLTIALINAKIIIASRKAVGVASYIPQTNILLKQWRGEGRGNRENGLGKKKASLVAWHVAFTRVHLSFGVSVQLSKTLLHGHAQQSNISINEH